MYKINGSFRAKSKWRFIDVIPIRKNLEHNYFKKKSGRQCSLPFWIFPGFLRVRISDLSSKEIKTNAAADSALFWRLPEKENRFRDVVKKFR